MYSYSYAKVNQVNIGLNNGLSPVWRQAIIWNNAGLLSIGPLGRNFIEIFFINENASENIVCKMVVIFARGRWVKSRLQQIQMCLTLNVTRQRVDVMQTWSRCCLRLVGTLNISLHWWHKKNICMGIKHNIMHPAHISIPNLKIQNMKIFTIVL